MRNEGLARALWLFFFILFCWPFFGVADRASTVLGIPAFLLYIFFCWGVLVAALAVVSRRMGE